jgi:hypothetical protein
MLPLSLLTFAVLFTGFAVITTRARRPRAAPASRQPLATRQRTGSSALAPPQHLHRPLGVVHAGRDHADLNEAVEALCLVDHNSTLPSHAK